jgi:uncharacterized membrane protein YqiK
MLFNTNIKDFNKEPLMVALKGLESYDPTIKKADYKNKTTILQALIARGFDMNQLPTKSSLKEANKMARRASRNSRNAMNEAMILTGRAAMPMPSRAPRAPRVAAARVKKPKMTAEEKAYMAARKKELNKEQAMVRKQERDLIRLTLKADKAKAKAAARTAKASARASAKASKLEYIRSIPEAAAVGPRFIGPLNPLQARLKRGKSSYKLNNLFV